MLGDNGGMRKLIVCAALTVSLAACAGKPDAAQCEQAIRHMLSVWAEADPEAADNEEAFEGMMPGLVAQCQKSYSKAKVQCLIEAATKAESDRC